jgi:hypothetical protein
MRGFRHFGRGTVPRSRQWVLALSLTSGTVLILALGTYLLPSPAKAASYTTGIAAVAHPDSRSGFTHPVAFSSTDPRGRLVAAANKGNSTLSVLTRNSTAPSQVVTTATGFNASLRSRSDRRQTVSDSLVSLVTMHWTFRYTPAYTKVLALALNGVPAAATVLVACHGRGCPFTKHLALLADIAQCAHGADGGHGNGGNGSDGNGNGGPGNDGNGNGGPGNDGNGNGGNGNGSDGNGCGCGGHGYDGCGCYDLPLPTSGSGGDSHDGCGCGGDGPDGSGCPQVGPGATGSPGNGPGGSGCPGQARCGTPAIIGLTRYFRQRRLGVGTQITVAITQPGWIGKYYMFKMRAGRGPHVQVACLAPGEVQPGAAC